MRSTSPETDALFLILPRKLGAALAQMLAHAQEMERQRDALKAARPEVARIEPVDPESEAANPVWDLVIQTCAQAWPAGLLTWSQSPTELIVKLIDERDEARASLYEIKHVAFHFLEGGEERVSDSEVAFDLPNEDYDKLVALLGDAHPEPAASAPSPLARIKPENHCMAMGAFGSDKRCKFPDCKCPPDDECEPQGERS